MSRPEIGTLEVRKIRREFGRVRAVDTLNLKVEKGEFLTLLGPSGCGKTTLLRMIAGLERPDTGSILISGLDMTHSPPERRPVNYVFQNYALFPHLNVERNIGFGLKVAGTNANEAEKRVSEAIAVVQLQGLELRRVDQLSGGQQQRVALARAIINKPDILLLDEPLGALDLKLRREMQYELRQLHRRLGSTFIYVTHDQEEALTMSDRIIVMRNGTIEQSGSPKDIYKVPATRFVAEFIGETNILLGTCIGSQVKLECGAEFEARAEVSGQVAVSVRPEDIWISINERKLSDKAVTLTGRIVDTLFLGSFNRHKIELDGGIMLTIQQAAINQNTPLPGDSVAVSWLPHDAVVLPV